MQVSQQRRMEQSIEKKQLKMEDFKKIRRIGQGGFGKVYQVKSPQNIQYAMKVIGYNEENKIKAEEETLLCLQLDHPNLIKTFFAIDDEIEGLCIIMELCQRNLAQVIKVVTEEEVKIEMAKELAEGIRYLHEEIGVIHRDIKPENILITKNKIKISDLGIAKLNKHNLMTRTNAGTNWYKAPEMFSNQRYGLPIDIWALGIVFLQLFSEKRIYKILNGEKSPGEREQFPRQNDLKQIKEPKIKQLVQLMLHHSPKQRPTIAKIIKQLIATQQPFQTTQIKQEPNSLLQIKQARIQQLQIQNQNLKRINLKQLKQSQDCKKQFKEKQRDFEEKIKELIIQNQTLRKQLTNFNQKITEVSQKSNSVKKEDKKQQALNLQSHVSLEKLQFNEIIQKQYDNGKYIGQMKEGRRNGNGLMIYKKGDKYEGGWQNDKHHGQGVYQYASGSRYEGRWQNGKMNGKGIYLNKSGNRYEGEFQEGKYHGKGVYQWGKASQFHGDKYQGDYQNGKRHGKGIYSYADGMRYDGEYQNGKKQGKGVQLYANGTRYEGEFKEGQKYGKGVYFTVNNGNFSQQWKDSIQVSSIKMN